MTMENFIPIAIALGFVLGTFVFWVVEILKISIEKFRKRHREKLRCITGHHYRKGHYQSLDSKRAYLFWECQNCKHQKVQEIFIPKT